VSIEGFPSESYPGILALLSELPYEYRWSTRFIFMDQHEAEAHLEKYRKKWRQKVVGFFDKLFKTNTGVVDRDALAMVDDAERGIAEIKSGQTAHGYYTSVIVVMDNNCQRADAHALEIYEAVNTIGFAARIETVNAVEAYLGSLPAHSAENIRRPFVSTDNLSHLMPTSTTWTGSATAPCPHYPPGAPALMHCVTRGSTAFRYNLHDGDLGHTLIFGPTRSGKSVFLATLVAHLRQYKDITVFAFDKGNSLYALTRAIHASTGRQDGLHIRLGDDDSPLAFCPLQFLETKADRAWAMNWIDTILRLNDLQTTPEQRNEIGLAITSMYESSSCSISEFVYTVQDDAIRRALHQYTSDGSAGQLLDAPHDDLALANFTVFEIEELMKMDERYALPVLLYIFRRIERCLKGQPAVVILDEAWLMLGHPVFRSKIKEWLKVFAKANCAVVMATQSLSDAANSGILDVMVESCPNKTFLPNPNARETFALYERMGLNERDVEIIATAKPKRHYYYSSPLGKRLFELALGDVALSFVAQSDKETISEIRQLEERYGDDWVNAWLQQRGLAALEKEMAA
jgi:type IV secretion system protein VirB4